MSRPDYRLAYAASRNEPFPLPAFDPSRVDPKFLRQDVVYSGSEEPGTLIVDPLARHLFLIQSSRRATRYGIGVGKDGFVWVGMAQIQMKRAWPDWVPPREMIARDPSIRSQLVMMDRGLGVPGGPRSPLGARAMYLFARGKDTGFRIHGTLEPETIGTAVSSGCIRMINQDIVHLYAQVPDGANVLVLG